MDALKALASRMKKEVQEVSGGQTKYIKRTQLEEARLAKIREEEAKEREEKERKRKLQVTDDDAQAAKFAKGIESPPETPTVLSKEEVVRRLRALGEPATLFAETDAERLKRLRKAEVEMKVTLEDDEHGAGKGNALIELQRQRMAQEKARQSTRRPEDKGGDKAKAAGASAPDGKKQDGEQAGSTPEPTPEDATLAAFQRAASELAAKRKEDAMAVEDRIIKYVQKWMKDWEDDLDRRSEEVKDSVSGIQATFSFKQTARNMEPLYERLKHRAITDELLTGLWMMVQAIRERNYLHANDIYLKLAIGTAPWPIGVTQVGIHERSAREKISHVMNANGQAHIMNDEATRKYFQSLKRLVTQLQRLYPTDPSRSVDFDPVGDPGKGALGAGCAKLALIEAEKKGELPLALPAAPHFLDHDGGIRVPQKWQSILTQFRESSPSLAVGQGGSREGSPAPEPKQGGGGGGRKH